MKIHALIGALLLVATGCGDNQEPEAAVAFWNQLQTDDYRSNFARAPGWPGREPSNAIHADFVEIYINDVVVDALDAGEPITAWPDGSLIVKDGYDGDEELNVVAAMEKRDGAWFWAEWFDLESGEAKYSGSPRLCTDCHSDGDDFVTSFSFPAAQ